MIRNINVIGAKVTPEMHGYMYLGLFGYHGVIGIGKQLEATIVSNNEITLAEGLYSNKGRFAQIVGEESVAIENGTSGLTRIDLIVAHFETDGINEKHDIRVIKGTAGGAVPTYSSDDIYNGGTVSDLVLYQVILDGLNITSVDPMFEVFEPFCASRKDKEHVEAGGATGNTIVISASSFIENLDAYATYYPYVASVTIEGMTSTCFAEVVFTPETDAMYCMSGKVKTANGKLWLYADSLPTSDVRIESLIWRELA